MNCPRPVGVASSSPGVPAIPDVSARLFRGAPHLIVRFGLRHSLGWEDTKQDGPVFALVRVGNSGRDKVLDRFPLTEGGWAGAWAALNELDAEAAHVVAEHFREREAAGAALTETGRCCVASSTE